MAPKLITRNIWKELTKAAKSNKKKSFVAVAYFGNGGAKMLPLKSGSKLVVDASDRNIRAGQTDPRELIKLYKKGVQIYSFPNLHAKVYVIGSKLFFGSVNVSHNSAEQLQEAVMEVNDRNSVQSAKTFVESLCTVELGSEFLKELSKKYRPPRFNGNRKVKKSKSAVNTKSLQIRIVNLIALDDYPEGHEEPLEHGGKEAKKNRINKARHRVDEFHWFGSAPFKKGERLITVVKEGKRKSVNPPGVVIHKESWRTRRGGKSTFVFVETLDKRAKNIAQVKKTLNSNERRLVERGGYKSPELSLKLISLWK